MAKAVWNNRVLAQSDTFEEVEGNLYFPPDTINWDHFQPSETRTRCPWKGEASYYNLVVQGTTNNDAAWYYPDPNPEAAKIKDHVAFWRGVEVVL